MNQGYIKLHRVSENNKRYFSEPFTKRQARQDLILFANHDTGYIFIRGNEIIVKRGQIGWSQLTMGKRWKRSRNKVRKFLENLEKDSQIVQQKNSYTTVMTILNYETYQGKGTAEGTAEGQQKVQQKDSRRYTNKNDKNEKKNKNEKKIGIQDPPTKKIGDFFFSTQEQLDTLNGKYGNRNVTNMIDDYNEYIMNKMNGKNYKSPYMAINKRLKRSMDEGKIKINRSSGPKKNQSYEQWLEQEKGIKDVKKAFNPFS